MNSFTRSIGFNCMRLCVSPHEEERLRFLQELNGLFDTDGMVRLMEEIAGLIKAKVVNTSVTAYSPLGASASMLVAQPSTQPSTQSSAQQSTQQATVLSHLDQSHLAIHTYLESSPQSPVAFFRLECDVASCGEEDPLTALTHLLEWTEPDLAILDYRVRGLVHSHEGLTRATGKVIKQTPELPVAYRLMSKHKYGEDTLHYMIKKRTLEHNIEQELKRLFPSLVL